MARPRKNQSPPPVSALLDDDNEDTDELIVDPTENEVSVDAAEADIISEFVAAGQKALHAMSVAIERGKFVAGSPMDKAFDDLRKLVREHNLWKQ